MKLEVLLSVMNLNNKNLDKMNITSKCTVINQTNKKGTSNYKNFNIYSYNEKGLSRSRNRGLDHVTEDIIIFCDDDVVYYKDYEDIILNEFKNNKKADIIIFNIESPNRVAKVNKKNKRVHFYNYMRYTSTRIAFRRKSIIDNNIRFNVLFGPGSIYEHGDDTLFLTYCLNKGLKIYASNKYIAKVNQKESTWFKGYDKRFFFDKGAIFTAINYNFRHLLMLQSLIRHKETLTKYKFMEAYKIMLEGSKDYLSREVPK